jgi:hypothetical protein
MLTAADRSVCRGGQSATYQLAKRESQPPCERLHDWRRPDGKRRRDAHPSPSPSPQPRPATSLQLGLNKPKIERRVQQRERQVGQVALGEAGQVKRQLHDFLVTLE